MRFPLLLALAAAMLTSPTPAAEPDPADEGFLRLYAETFRFRNGKPADVKPLPGGKGVLFLRSGPRSLVRELYLFDVASGEERRLVAADELAGGAEKLSAEERARRERMRLAARGVARYHLSDDGRHVLIPYSGRVFLVEVASGALRELDLGGRRAEDPRLSPGGERVGFVADGDLWVVEVAGGEPRRLTRRESEGETVSYGLAEFIAQEEMDRYRGFWFSPDGRRLAVQRTDTAGMEIFRIADPARPEKAPQVFPYPRPGGRNADVSLFLVPVAGGEPRPIEWDRVRYPYLATVKWPEGAPLTLVVQNREQTEEAILAADPESGRTRTLHVERDSVWLNLDQDMPHWLPGGRGFLWTSERGGAWQLELRRPDGGLAATLSRPELGYRGFVHADAGAGAVYVHASADPTEQHLYRLPLDLASAEPVAGEPVRLTREPGVHEASFAPDGGLRVDAWAALTEPPRWRVRDAAGRELGELRSEQQPVPFAVDPELTTAGADPEIHAAVLRPRDFDPRKRYPVVLAVYGGPHRAVVTAARDDYVLNQWLADQGFVVVLADGRGTPYRGRAWERAIRGDFISLPLADQSAALGDLARRYPQLDLDRVGVFGWSFGGYFSALAAMRRGDLYRAAVAGAPVADWRDYDTHYTERYLGLPQADPEAYERSSVLTHAAALERPLLVLHGTADDNVYFLHSLKLSDALTRAGREHGFVPLVGATHMVREPERIERLYERIVTFLRRHLGEPEPR